jgi:hypothetical protein
MPKLVPTTQTGSLADHQRGTNDHLTGAAGSTNILFGDAYRMYDHSRGGDDTLIGGDASTNSLYGDA